MTEGGQAAGFTVDDQNYGVVWKLMSDGWASEFTDYSGGFALPIFLGGEAWQDYERTGEFESGPLFAFIGILYSWMEAGKWLFEGDQEELDDFRRKLLLHLGMQTNVESYEELLTSAAVWVRDNCGCVPSQRVLGGAVTVAPGSASVRYDFLLDTWLLLETVPSIDRIGASQSIVSTSRDLDLDELLAASDQGQQNVNSACYVMLAAMLILGMKSEFSALYAKLNNSYMRVPTASAKLESAAMKDNVEIDDLRLFTK